MERRACGEERVWRGSVCTGECGQESVSRGECVVRFVFQEESVWRVCGKENVW